VDRNRKVAPEIQIKGPTPRVADELRGTFPCLRGGLGPDSGAVSGRWPGGDEGFVAGLVFEADRPCGGRRAAPESVDVQRVTRRRDRRRGGGAYRLKDSLGRAPKILAGIRGRVRGGERLGRALVDLGGNGSRGVDIERRPVFHPRWMLGRVRRWFQSRAWPIQFSQFPDFHHGNAIQ